MGVQSRDIFKGSDCRRDVAVRNMDQKRSSPYRQSHEDKQEEQGAQAGEGRCADHVFALIGLFNTF